ncbi:unnamed protein product [Schistosoma rodhaini]|uniref:Deoxyhypusine hydroxylase n=1 Tax=Schistosoma rodhaini TaxID=6188 RepID=A0AA85EK28_9TREM|nr:unnamed protein product [Schistosoma rodhaini]CAH8659499.1 unnamed protein product [Schistosoma rodhaini]
MTPKPVSETELREWGKCLLNPSATLVDRSRALWGLRHAAESLALELLADFVCNYVKPSPIANDLLQHEAAYCLGQRGDPKAVPYLLNALHNDKHVTLIRHEAAEALAALSGCDGADIEVIEKALKEYVSSNITELAETCQVGLNRIEWIKNKKTGQHKDSQALYDLAAKLFPNTIDPAHSFTGDQQYTDEQLHDLLMDPNQNLFTRYRAMFTLRDRVLQAVIDKTSPEKPAGLLAEGLKAPNSALLRHEVAFVLGQLTVASTVPQLSTCVRQTNEHPMVRHEAAEALGSILGELEGKYLTNNVKGSIPKEFEHQAREVLEEFTKDKEPVVRESCVLALDIANYIASPEQFQYAAVPQN